MWFGQQHLPKVPGTHRARAAGDTLRAYAHLLPRLGITRLANLTGLDDIGIPVFAAIRPASRLLSISLGKGSDPLSAKVSAMMESIEGWHAENLVLETRRESYDELRRVADVVDVARLPHRSERTLDASTPIDWVCGRDLISEHDVWIPREVVDLDSVRATAFEPIFEVDSNGLASGNHPIEAVVHALTELIERDATSLFFLDPRDPTGKSRQVDVATVRDARCRSLLDRIESANVRAGVFDVTSDVGVPAYQVVVFDDPDEMRRHGYFWGFGCHLDKDAALARAITEAVQCRLAQIAGSREDIESDVYEAERDPEVLRDMERSLFDEPAPLDYAARPSLDRRCVQEDLRTILQCLRAVGLESAVAVDLTRPELGVPVVRVVVPGLEGRFRPDYVPQERGRRLMEAA